MIIDIVLLIILAAVTWCVVGEGPWGAAITLLSVIFSGLLAMNFFEPLAVLLEEYLGGFSPYADLISLLGLFAILVSVCRFAADRISPSSIELDGLAYQGTQWILAVATGYVTMAFLLTALHTAPLPREFLGFQPERMNLFGMAAPDRQWLGFTQYVSERVFFNDHVFDGARQAPGTAAIKTWSSFPIRYATRRDQYAQAAVAAAQPAGLIVPAAPAGQTPGGGSASGATF